MVTQELTGLGIMAHDLITNKKIGKVLYSKMMNLTYDRTREETLKTNIDVLTSIKDNVQSTISKGEISLLFQDTMNDVPRETWCKEYL